MYNLIDGKYTQLDSIITMFGGSFFLFRLLFTEISLYDINDSSLKYNDFQTFKMAYISINKTWCLVSDVTHFR